MLEEDCMPHAIIARMLSHTQLARALSLHAYL